MVEKNEFGFTTYVEPVKENPYDKVVKALIEAGEGVAYPLTVALADVNKARVKFSAAARANNKTARLRETSPVDETGFPVADKDGNVTLTFTLTNMRNSGTRKRRTVAVEGTENAE